MIGRRGRRVDISHMGYPPPLKIPSRKSLHFRAGCGQCNCAGHLLQTCLIHPGLNPTSSGTHSWIDIDVEGGKRGGTEGSV